MKRLRTILSLFTALLLLVGCNTYQKQLNTFRAFAVAHNDQLAPLCATYFPVKDSVGKIVVDSTHKANNQNYQGKIDSLQQIADAFAKHLATDTVKSNPCAPVAKQYQAQVDALKTRITVLQQAYKPCKPDTVYQTQTVFRVDSAKLVALRGQFNIKADSLKTVKQQLADETKTAKSRLTWLLIVIGGLVVLIALKLWLKF